MNCRVYFAYLCNACWTISKNLVAKSISLRGRSRYGTATASSAPRSPRGARHWSDQCQRADCLDRRSQDFTSGRQLAA